MNLKVTRVQLKTSKFKTARISILYLLSTQSLLYQATLSWLVCETTSNKRRLKKTVVSLRRVQTKKTSMKLLESTKKTSNTSGNHLKRMRNGMSSNGVWKIN